MVDLLGVVVATRHLVQMRALAVARVRSPESRRSEAASSNRVFRKLKARFLRPNE